MGGMAADCCAVHPVHHRHRRVLQLALWINGGMFLFQLVAGLAARSTALLADLADMLGDAIVYGFSLYVIGRGPAWQARAALLKGGIMAAFGIGILAEAGLKLAHGLTPDGHIMWRMGLVALAANVAVLLILWPHRTDDINMRSVWLCSRNDVVAGAAVLVAALSVTLTGSAWPDLLIGLGIAGLFAVSAVGVVRAALRLTPTRSGL